MISHTMSISRDIAMNSWIEFASLLVAECLALLRLEIPGLASSVSRYTGAKELEATKRVYSHPIFKQNLFTDV